MGIVNKTHTIEVPITTSAGAYTAGDVVGGRLDLSELCGAGGGGVIRDVIISDDANQSAALNIHFFDAEPTEIANGDPFATGFAFADLQKRKKNLAVAAADYEVINSNAQAIKEGLAISHGTGGLWAYIVCVGTPTFGASSAVLILKVTGWKD